MEYFDLVKKNVCRVEHGDKRGSGFLIADNKILTAKHCLDLDSDEKIVFKFLELEGEDKIIESKVSDCVSDDSHEKILILNLDRSLKFKHLKIAKMILRRNYECETFGYPEVLKITGNWIGFNINDILKSPNFDERNFDITLKIEPSCKIHDFSGLSGSPLIIDKTVVGVITLQATANNKAILVRAIDLNKCENYLINNGMDLPKQKKKLGKKPDKSNIKTNITNNKNSNNKNTKITNNNFSNSKFSNSSINFGKIINKK